jgi:hypothetical protein
VRGRRFLKDGSCEVVKQHQGSRHGVPSTWLRKGRRYKIDGQGFGVGEPDLIKQSKCLALPFGFGQRGAYEAQ